VDGGIGGDNLIVAAFCGAAAMRWRAGPETILLTWLFLTRGSVWAMDLPQRKLARRLQRSNRGTNHAERGGRLFTGHVWPPPSSQSDIIAASCTRPIASISGFGVHLAARDTRIRRSTMVDARMWDGRIFPPPVPMVLTARLGMGYVPTQSRVDLFTIWRRNYSC